MPGRDPSDALRTACRSPSASGDVGAGEQRGQVADVEAGLDEVGERQGGGGVGGAAGPRGVEDRAGAGQVAGDGDPPADLDDGRVAAGPGGEMAQCARRAPRTGPTRSWSSVAPQTPKTASRVSAVGRYDADLVRPPVADRPQRIGVAPQELGADGEDRAALVVRAGRPDGPAAALLHPTNQRIAASTDSPCAGANGAPRTADRRGHRRAVVATMLP